MHIRLKFFISNCELKITVAKKLKFEFDLVNIVFLESSSFPAFLRFLKVDIFHVSYCSCQRKIE